MTIWRWLGSHNGRVFLQWSAFAASATTYGVFHSVQTVFLDKYKEFVQCYSKGLPTPVPENVKKLYDQAIEDTKIMYPGDIDLFLVYGFDMFHAGGAAYKTGSLLGVPINFSYEEESDVDEKIKVVEKTIDWLSEAGKSLKSALVLSEDARKFAIAREAFYLDSGFVWFHSLVPCLSVLGCYIFARTLNERMNTRQHPFRFIMYSVVTCFFYTIYCSVTDLLRISQDGAYDESAAAISPSYAKGGIEFYTKTLERNKAVRSLMGEAGEKLYTASGNEVTFIRTKSMPLCDRLHELREYVKNLEVKQVET